MRLDASKGKTAAEILNTYEEKKLSEIFWQFGEEKAANKIAKKIVEARKKKTLSTTTELNAILEEVSSHIKTKMRVYQALRIEVNGELDALKKSLQDSIDILES